jgi:hypothetical protein
MGGKGRKIKVQEMKKFVGIWTSAAGNLGNQLCTGHEKVM